MSAFPQLAHADDGLDGKVALQWGDDPTTRVTLADDGGLDGSDTNERPSTIDFSTGFSVQFYDGSTYSKYLVIDTTNQNNNMPVHQRGMHFESAEAFYKFALDKLLALPVTDKRTGALIGVEWFSFQVGTPVYSTADGVVHPVSNFMTTFIGGLEKKIYIAGTAYDLSGNEKGQVILGNGSSQDVGFGGPADDDAATSPDTSSVVTPMASGSGRPSGADSCTSDGTNCFHGSSFNNHIPPFGVHIYDHVGSTTSQTSGGFESSSHFCWKFGFIPWSCTTTSGSNMLQTQTLFFDAPPGTPAGTAHVIGFLSIFKENVPSVSSDATSFEFGISSENIPLSLPPKTSVSNMVGACGTGFDFRSSNTLTAAGRTTSTCN